MSLVLARRDDEGVTVTGPDGVLHIGVRIVRDDQGRVSHVSLVLDAPPEWNIVRDELLKSKSARP